MAVARDGTARIIDVLEHRIGKNISFNIRLQFDTPGALRAAIEAGSGVGALFEAMVAHALDRGSLKDLAIYGLDLHGHSCLVYLKGEFLSSVAQQFIEFTQRWSLQESGLAHRSPPGPDTSRQPDKKNQAKKQKLSRILTER